MSEHENHNEIMRSLGNIEGRLDGIIERLNVANGRLNSHANSIQDIKSWKDLIMGKMTVLIALIGVGTTLLINYVTRKLL